MAKSEISEVGMLGIYPRHFNDDVSSQSSESLRYICVLLSHLSKFVPVCKCVQF